MGVKGVQYMYIIQCLPSLVLDELLYYSWDTYKSVVSLCNAFNELAPNANSLTQ